MVQYDCNNYKKFHICYTVEQPHLGDKAPRIPPPIMAPAKLRFPFRRHPNQSSCSPHSRRSHRIALAIGTGAADTGTVAAHEPVPPRVAALSPGAAVACRRCGATAGKPRPSREGANQSVASGHSLAPALGSAWMSLQFHRQRQA